MIYKQLDSLFNPSWLLYAGPLYTLPWEKRKKQGKHCGCELPDHSSTLSRSSTKLQGFAAAHFSFSSNLHLWRGSPEGDPHLLVKQIKQANVSIFLHSQAKGDSNIHPYIDMFAYTDNTVWKDYWLLLMR